MIRRFVSTLLLVIILALIYFAAGKLGLRLAFVNPSATAVWPPTGIALAACLLLGDRAWPGILLGAFLVNVSTSGSIPTSIAIAVGNTLEGLVGAYLVNRFAHGRQVFGRAQDIFKFALLAGMVATAVSATFGVTSLAVSGLAAWADYAAIWLTWWLGDATGAMIVTPLLILWVLPSSVPWNRGRVLEASILLVSLIFVGLAVFDGRFPFGAKNLPLEFAILPIVVWSAFRFGQRGSATATVILSTIALLGTLQGFGPFARDTPNEALLLLQAFMSTVAITGLVLAAVVAERREAEETLQQLNAVLEQRIDERTVQLRASNAQLQNEVVQRQQAQRRLEESQAQLRQLSAYLETSREQERAEMAREIHDELGQQLTGLKMDLLHLNKTVAQNRADALRDRIRSMSELLDNTIQTVRRVASSLRPAILDDFGLLAALEWQLQEFQKRTGISCRLDSAVDALELEPESTTALFRVCQEALTNVARHAQATAVEVTVEVQDAYLVVQIKDNGQGIAPHKLNNHQSLGLVGMRERVRLIGGTWEINSTSGTGTTIRVTVPWPQGQPSTFDDERSTYQD